MPYSDQEAFLNAYLKNYAKAQQNAINSGKTGMSSARYTGQQAMKAAPTTLPDYGDIASSFTTAYTKQLAAVEAQREKEAKAAQAAAEKEARAAASAAKKASSSTTKSKKLKKEELKALDAELEEMAKTRVAMQERKETRDANTRERIKENVGDTAGISSLTAASRTFAPERKGNATKKRISQRLAAGVKGFAKGASAYKQMQKARGGVSAEDSVDLGGGQTPQATAAKQRARTKSRASVAKQNFTTQELDARLTATNQRMRELQKQGKTKTREYRQLQNQHDTYATALGVDSLAGRAGAIELGAFTGFGGGVANMGDATLRAIRGQSASMDIPEYEAASDDLQAANEQRDALIQMGRAYTDGPDGPVATPEFQKVLDEIKAAKDVRAENQITPEQNKVVKSILDYSTEQTQKAQAGLNDQGRLLVGAIGGASQIIPAAVAAAAAPEAAPVLIPVLMGASAAGNRVNELEQRGIPLNQAILRGAMSGAVSGVTNKLPIEQGAELIAGGGPGVLRAIARQALSEGGQEASEYAADYGIDVLAGDPDANFSLAELGQQALGGALGGAISAAGSSLIGSGVNRAREALEANGNAPVDTDVKQAEPVSPDTETAPQHPTAAAQDAVQSPVAAAVEAFRNGTLTNQQLDDLKPGGALRSEFEAATGMTLPETSSKTRKVLKAGAQNEIPYLKPVDSAENTGYDGTNETYTGGASYDGAGSGERSFAEQDGEGRDGIPELFRDAENGSGAKSGEISMGGRDNAGGSQVLRGFLTLSPETQASIERSGATPLELRDTTSDPQLFSYALDEAIRKNSHGLMVSPKTVEELSSPGTRTFMSADNMAGALVTADGDIEAVFKNPQSKAKQAATSLLITAVENGGRKLDCYGKGLVKTYNQRGFEAVAKIPFNAEFAPDGWSYGKQDVYVMKLRDGVTAHDIAANLNVSEENGGYHLQTIGELAALPVFDDYDEALAYRDSLLTTPAESGNIPELMPTANQSVQEPIPTLADHPNTVGSAQRQFDRPEVASQSHMTRDTDNDYLQPLVQRDQGGEQKFTHERVSNADRMKIAANSMETESRDEIVSRLTSKEQWDADDTALAGSVLREWDLALGDMDKSGEAYKQALAQKMKFTQRISESNTMNAQALQMTQEFTTPETAVMQSQKSIKTAVDRVANGKNKRKFDQYKSDVETAIANAEDTATQKANDAVQKAIETVRQQVANETDQPSVEDALDRELAAAVNRYATDGKEVSVEDVVQSEMLSQLTKMATSDTEKGARPKKPKLTVEQKLQTALDNQETYTQAWEAAKEALVERYKDNADMSSRLQAFFNDAGESGLYGKDTIKQLVSKYTKDQGIDFKTLVKKSREYKQATLREIQDRIQDTFDMDDTQAQRIAEMAMNEYSKALSEAADANLKAFETKLAAAVNRYATDGKEASVEDVVQSEMLSQLTKMATSDTEKGARPKKPKLTVEQKLQTALDNQETYTQAWEAAKEALVERYKDNADMSSRLQAFFNDAGESGLYGKDTIKQLVSKYTKDQGIDFKTLVKKSREYKQATLREIQERIQDTFDMDDTQAQRIAEMAMNEYSKALSEAADSNLKAMGRKLAAAVKRHSTDGKEVSVEDVMQSEMLSQLTKMATSDTEKGARPKKPKLTVEQKLQTALDNQETYTQAWEAAKEALAERYKDNPDMSSRLQAFFNDAGESGLYGKDTIKQLVSKYTKDQGIDFKALVKKSRGDKQSVLREIQERIQDTFDMDDTQAQRIAEMAMNEYSKALSEAADANLKAILGGKGKTSKSTHDHFLELLRMGIYDNEDVKAYAASKFGVQPLTAEQCQQILDLTEQAEALPANSRERVDLENKAATIAAKNVTSSWWDTINSLRFTSMLLNARTNLINNGGNITQGANARMKDIVLAGEEYLVDKVLDLPFAKKHNWRDKSGFERTTSIVSAFTPEGRALLSACAADADMNYRQLATGSDKIDFAQSMQQKGNLWQSHLTDDSGTIVRGLFAYLDGRAKASSKSLESGDYKGFFGMLDGLRGINKQMDSAIDWVTSQCDKSTQAGVLGVAGLKNNYARSLAQYLKANGLDQSIFNATDEASMQILDKARAHALTQAFINTFHADSQTATIIAKGKRSLSEADGWHHKFFYALAEGELPFVKTPINVAKQAMQYSPLGFASTAIEGAKVATGSGDFNVMLDHAAASVTGTSLFVLGAILARKGLLTGGIDDDDKVKADMEGRQEYSLQLADENGKLHSYTISWANSVAIPMLAGAEFANLTTDDDVSLNDIYDATTHMLEPLITNTFLQGMNNSFENLRYSRDGFIPGLTREAITGYATQYVPTFLGQVARTVDPIRRSTYSGTTGIESDFGYTANKMRNKIPFLSQTSQPYIDAFGDTEENPGGNFVGRLAYNMFSPGYYSETTDDPVQLGLLDLANSTGNDEVIPELAAKKLSWTVDKEKHTYQLSPQEYTDFATQQGKLRKDMAEAVLDSRYTEEQQVELIPELYSTAGKIAALDIVPDYSVGTEERKRIDIYNQYGIDGLMNWIAYRKYANTDGKTGINQSEARAWLNDSDMSEAMKDAFWAASSSNWKSSR